MSSYFDSTNSNVLTGILRRKYAVLKPDEEPLKGLQKTTWKATRLVEYRRERIGAGEQKKAKDSPSLTLKFENNGFTFTQAGPSNRQHTQAGTVQYAQPVSGVAYAVDLLVERETETRDGQLTSRKYPYTTVRTLISYDDKDLVLSSNGSSGDRPTPDDLSNEAGPVVFSRYRRIKGNEP